MALFGCLRFRGGFLGSMGLRCGVLFGGLLCSEMRCDFFCLLMLTLDGKIP